MWLQKFRETEIACSSIILLYVYTVLHSALKIYFVIFMSFSVSFCSCSLSGESSKLSGYLSGLFVINMNQQLSTVMLNYSISMNLCLSYWTSQ